MAFDLKQVLTIIIILVMVMISASAIFMPFFGNVYEYGFGTQPCQRDSDGCTSGKTNLGNGYCTGATSTVIACTSCNTTTGYATFLSSCSSLISALNGTNCYQCSNFGFKSSVTGMMLFILFIGIVALILLFVTKVLPKFR